MILKEVREKKKELLRESNPECVVNVVGSELPHMQGKRLFFSIHDYAKFGISLCVSGPYGATYGECFIGHAQFEQMVEKMNNKVEELSRRCPNDQCESELVSFQKPPALFWFMPESMIDLLVELQETKPERASEIEEELKNTYLMETCLECGFIQLEKGQDSTETEI